MSKYIAKRRDRVAVGALVFFALLMIMLPSVEAATIKGLSDFAYGLDSGIVISNTTMNASPSIINAKISVRNPDDLDWIVYLLSNDNGSWKVQNILGVIKKNSSSTFSLDFEAKYAGKKGVKNQYAIVATGNDVPLGRYFTIEEDWSKYELEQNQKIVQGAQILIPIFAIFIIIMLYMLAGWAYGSDGDEEEYSIKTLFLPKVAGRPAKEIIADLLIHPFVWVLEILLLFAIATIIYNSAWDGSPKITIILLTLVGALIMPLIYFALVWIYDNLVEKMPMRFLAGAFIWGITAAVISLIVNSMQASVLSNYFGLDTAAIVLITTAIVAPFVEELAKGLGLLALWGHHEYSDTLHGLHLGLAVGLGFSFVENWLYFASKTNPLELGLASWASLIIYRSFFNSIAHASFSATLGGSLGWAKSHSWGKISILAFIPGLIAATVLHSIFNITAIMDGFEALNANFPVYKYNPTMIITLLCIVFVMLIGATIERRQTMIDKAGKVSGKD
ncbi:MAG: PrsW family intramembrane metalloprotease [Candidatus Micrarchaeia archaeon]